MTTAAGSGRAGATTLSREHPMLLRLGRAGWLVKGLVYVLAGLLGIIVVAPARPEPATVVIRRNSPESKQLKRGMPRGGGPTLRPCLLRTTSCPV